MAKTKLAISVVILLATVFFVSNHFLTPVFVVSELNHSQAIKYSYTALMVEARSYEPLLEMVISNFAENLGPEWQIHILHARSNEKIMQDVVERHQSNGDRIKLFELEIGDNFTVAEYNALFYREDFYQKYIPTETFLIFQTDSLINPNGKHLLQPFLVYDYVGSPWVPGIVGNGGLSLRKKSKMLEILKKCKNTSNVFKFEDSFYSNPCPEALPLSKPKADYAMHFSIQQMFTETFWAIHKPWSKMGLASIDSKKYAKLVEIMPLIATLQGHFDFVRRLEH